MPTKKDKSVLTSIVIAPRCNVFLIGVLHICLEMVVVEAKPNPRLVILLPIPRQTGVSYDMILLFVVGEEEIYSSTPSKDVVSLLCSHTQLCLLRITTLPSWFDVIPPHHHHHTTLLRSNASQFLSKCKPTSSQKGIL